MFQFSSVSAFNDVSNFDSLQLKIGQEKSLTHSIILVLASTAHRELVEKNEWSWSNTNKPILLPCFKCNKDVYLAKYCLDFALGISTSSVNPSIDKGWTRTKDPNGREHMSKHRKHWHWCNKCNRWNLTGPTNDHVRRPKPDPKTNSDKKIVATADSKITGSNRVSVVFSNKNTDTNPDILSFAKVSLQGLCK